MTSCCRLKTLRRLASATAIVAGLLGVSAAAQAPPDIDTLLARVSQRLEQYYRRAQQIVCMEKATVLPIAGDLGAAGFMRVTESELRIEPETSTDGENVSNVKFVRNLLKINGRPPREKDKKDRASCTDPNPLTAEPLAFLLPGNRDGYTFTAGGSGKGKDRGSLIIDFTIAVADRDGKIVEDERGVEDCYNISVPASIRGRIWVDATSYEVLRLEQHLAGLGEVRVSFAQQRKHNLPTSMTMERYDTAIRYRTFTFSDPDEVMLLPESIETVAVWRNGVSSTRRRQEYSNYRRFLTAGRVVK
jgi:hypothetical protein